jgi:c-di-GMP-binding flagellar brake protein YcgR
MNFMQERRKYLRKHPVDYLNVFDSKTHQLSGSLMDLTPEGMMLSSGSPFPLKTTFKFRMALPDTNLGKRHITVDAESVWCCLDDNSDFYDYYTTGFRFRNISPRNVEVINRVIHSFAFDPG